MGLVVCTGAWTGFDMYLVVLCVFGGGVPFKFCFPFGDLLL